MSSMSVCSMLNGGSSGNGSYGGMQTIHCEDIIPSSGTVDVPFGNGVLRVIYLNLSHFLSLR